MAIQAFARTASDLVAEVLMIRSAFTGPIVLVEGSSDSRFFKRHLTPIAQVTICGGKQTALVAMAQLVVITYGCLGIVDRDFDDHKGILPATNIFYTDTHDTETLLLSFRLDTVLNELGDEGKLKRFRQSHGDVGVVVLEQAEKFGKLRFLNEVSPAFCVGMSSLTPWKYTNQATWQVDEQRLRQDFAALCGYTTGQLLALITGVPPLNSWKDVRGHDTIAILSMGLKKVLGNGSQVGEAQLSSSLRLAFTEDDFKLTQLYSGLKGWEQATGLNVLAH